MISADEVERAVDYLREAAPADAQARANAIYLAERTKSERARFTVAQAGMSNAAARDIRIGRERVIRRQAVNRDRRKRQGAGALAARRAPARRYPRRVRLRAASRRGAARRSAATRLDRPAQA
mgnify:CR=1 FL=1